MSNASNSLWEVNSMGTLTHIEACEDCSPYLVHIASCWGSGERGLRDLVKAQVSAQGRISLLEAELLHQTEALKSHSEKNCPFQNQVSALLAEVQSAPNLVELQNRNQELDAQAEKYKQLLLVTENENSKLQQDLKEALTERDKLRADLAKPISSPSTEGLAIREDNNRLRDQLHKREQQFQDARYDLETAKSNLSDSRRSITELTIQNQALLDKYNQLEKQKQELSDAQAKLVLDKTELERQITQANRTVANLTAERDSSQLKTLEYKHEITKIVAEKDSLRKRSADYDSLVADFDELQESHESLKLQHQDLVEEHRHTVANLERLADRSYSDSADLSHLQEPSKKRVRSQSPHLHSSAGTSKRHRQDSPLNGPNSWRDAHNDDPQLDYGTPDVPTPTKAPVEPIVPVTPTSSRPDIPRTLVTHHIAPVNQEYRVPPTWVPDCAHVSVVDGKWRTGEDKVHALENESRNLPPTPDVPFGTGLPSRVDQVKEYIDLAHESGNHYALSYVVSWIKCTELIPPNEWLAWMKYLRTNWRKPDWVKDNKPDGPVRRPGSGHIARRRAPKVPKSLQRPAWGDSVETWAHYLWSSPKTSASIPGVVRPKNNNGIKLRQVRGYLMVASRAPHRNHTEETVGRTLWFKRCAELLAYPNRYRDCCDELALDIARDEIPEPVHPPPSGDYTYVDAARELARQGVSVKAADDAQPYGFFWILYHTRSPSASIAQEMMAHVKAINEIPKATVDELFRYSPEIYPDPTSALEFGPAKGAPPSQHQDALPSPPASYGDFIFADDDDAYYEDD